MAINFPCWNCGKSLRAADQHAGRKCKCTGCEQVNTVPVTANQTMKQVQQLASDRQSEQEVVYLPNEPEEVLVPFRQISSAINSVGHSKGPSNKFLTALGTILLLVGCAVVVFYIFIYDTSVAAYPDWARIDPSHDYRIYNTGRMNQQLVGSIGGGLSIISGAILIGISRMRR